jgi:hypothetical protein
MLSAHSSHIHSYSATDFSSSTNTDAPNSIATLPDNEVTRRYLVSWKCCGCNHANVPTSFPDLVNGNKPQLCESAWCWHYWCEECKDIDSEDVDGEEVNGEEINGEEINGEEINGEEVDGEDEDGEDVEEELRQESRRYSMSHWQYL